MFWGLSMVRAVAGFIVIASESLFATFHVSLTRYELFLAGYVVFIDSSLSVDHIFATTNASWFLVSCILGFFIFEELALIYFDLRYQTFSKELHLHHILGFSLYFIAAWYGIAHYYVLKIYVLEASTPFSCLCWCLLKLKMERTKVWKVNQWILIYIFHARTLYELHCWYVCYQDWAYMKANLPLAFIVNMLAALIIVTFWLTPYWTYRKTVQFFFHIDWNMEVKEQCKGKNSKAS